MKCIATNLALLLGGGADVVAKFRDGVMPIVGSAAALIHRSRKVLVTAEHVLSDNAEVQLFIFARDRQSRFLDRKFSEARSRCQIFILNRARERSSGNDPLVSVA
ncbi:hypothetical protein [Bradyrhizobium sp. USDA 4452]